jgi:pSer/pThr/pTyr-binding forkhead associated (FHA) protein
LNDIVITKEPGTGARHFVIQYEEGDKRYTIKDLENGSGTFVKIRKDVELKTNYIVSFGE